ncbi:hypothetical protein KUCAC02_002598 [Chaenocephalus aceratus]|uniref:Uncharacterized protein n=1 Tax=Chaenocephalus aceratus TaxID=36190 RepID=A0ACB9XW03_CHAAC|nr:hypothetical protein KUCAC02_002598 [Chaenocephalus aceratus]
MSNPPATKACDIFTRGRSRSIKTAPPSPRSDSEDSNMANIADVLSELKSLRADFGTKLDNIDTRRIHHAEKTLEKTEATLDSVNKRIAYLESKTDDLENRGRRKNLRLFGIREGAEGQQTLLNFDGGKISFVQDLSAETVQIRRGFNTITKLFVDINAFRGFQHNPCKLRVLHNGKINLFTTLQEAEKFYKSIKQ